MESMRRHQRGSFKTCQSTDIAHKTAASSPGAGLDDQPSQDRIGPPGKKYCPSLTSPLSPISAPTSGKAQKRHRRHRRTLPPRIIQGPIPLAATDSPPRGVGQTQDGSPGQATILITHDRNPPQTDDFHLEKPTPHLIVAIRLLIKANAILCPDGASAYKTSARKTGRLTARSMRKRQAGQWIGTSICRTSHLGQPP